VNIQDSAGVKNRIRIGSILIVALIYLIVIIATADIAFSFVAIIISLIAITITTVICNKEIESVKSDSLRFKKSLPFKYFGDAFGDFQHVFYHKESLETEILSTIVHNLQKKNTNKKVRNDRTNRYRQEPRKARKAIFRNG
jgi:glucan phosphoethanolaminetransferase (alkaline phosphatase superfamily)